MLLSWALGTLHYGIRASGSNTGLYGLKNQSELVKFVVAYFVCDRFGGKTKILERNPQFRE
jgi:hypothetical protein